MKQLLNNDGVQIAIDKNEPRISHKVMAETLGVTAKSAMQLITDYQSDLEEMGVMRFQNAKPTSENGGRPERIAYLNEDQCYLLLTYSRNTAKARAAKIQLVKAFRSAREAVVHRQTQYLPMYHTAHDGIQAIARKAQANGSTTPESVHHMNYEKLINTVFGLDANMRDRLTVAQQCNVTAAYSLIERLTLEADKQGFDHHQTYQLVKTKLTGMAGLLNTNVLEVAA